MLLTLRLKDFILVDESELDFRPGFTALTGETGAGKSILLDALGLLLGGRGDAAVVRDGRQRAELSAEFSVTPEVRRWLADADLPADEDVTIVRRTVDSDGRSRVQVNGRPVTIAQLRGLGELLVDIHGQHESQGLMRAGAQRALLDRFGRLGPQVRRVSAAHATWVTAQRALEAARTGSRETALRAERLGWELEQIDALQLADGEWDSLSAEQHRLSHAHELAEGAGQAAESLARGDDAMVQPLRCTTQRLRALAEVDPALRSSVEMLESAAIQIEEAAGELSAYAQQSDLDPQRLAVVEERVAQIFDVARRLHLAPEGLPAHACEVRRALDGLHSSMDLAALEQQAQQARSTFDESAAGLSAARHATAGRLQSEATVHLRRLGMETSELIIACEGAPPGPEGTDLIDFRIRSHEGATPRSIGRYASGGELSRICLAIAVVAAEANPVPVLIFDEADAGIGGSVAAVVGELLQKLGQGCQVLCVTHLAQVASRADQHLRVCKSTARKGQAPSSRVMPLEPDDRIDELARMLGSRTVTNVTRANAREMLQGAQRQ